MRSVGEEAAGFEAPSAKSQVVTVRDARRHLRQRDDPSEESRSTRVLPIFTVTPRRIAREWKTKR